MKHSALSTKSAVISKLHIMTAQYRNFDPDNFRNILLLAVVLTLVAALPRLYNLGDLGFYMDEETTSFASRSMAETGKPQMPSGMPYHRALPHTWLNSISARIFGLNNELSYRLPGALFGILTIPLVFLLARPYVGTSVALLAALLLAVSEWHIIVSRQARMYAPFLFFYIACTFSILRWAQKDKIEYLILSITLFILAATFHNLGVFAAFVPLIALFVKGYTKTPYYKLIIFSVVAGVSAYLYGRLFIVGPYQQWKDAYIIVTSDTASNNFLLQNLSINGLVLAQGFIGFMLGIWLARSSKFIDIDNGKEFRVIVRYLLSISFGCLAASGHLYGALLSILLLLMLYPDSLTGFIKQVYKPVIVISVIALFVSIALIVKLGVFPGIKSLLTFPYPNWFVLNAISPGITLLFISAMLYLAAMKKSTDNYGALVLVIIGLFPIIVVGIFKQWAPARYLLEAYPFMLILSAYALHVLLSRFFPKNLGRKQVSATVVLFLIGLSGVLGGHGLVQAYKSGAAQHGDTLNQAALVFDVYPDHKFPGEFVATHRKAGDIVIAEDALVQRWYAGKVDYWLRNYESHKKFIFKGEDKNLRDIYVNSISATPEILESLSNIKNRIIWIITSSETLQSRDHYLNQEQRRWLKNIEENHAPVFTGEDNLTKVYCLNCKPDDWSKEIE